MWRMLGGWGGEVPPKERAAQAHWCRGSRCMRGRSVGRGRGGARAGGEPRPTHKMAGPGGVIQPSVGWALQRLTALPVRNFFQISGVIGHCMIQRHIKEPAKRC